MYEIREKFSAAMSHLFIEKKINQAAFAQKVEMSPPSVGDYKLGRREGSEALRRKIAAGLGWDYQEMLDFGNWILEGKDPGEWKEHLKKQEILTQLKYNITQMESATEGVWEKNQPYIVSNLEKLPVISFVQAGEWHEVIDNFQPGDAEEWISTTSKLGKRAFALKVVGKSMEPEFREGEYISVDPDAQVESGDFVIAKNGDEEATFKQYYKDGSKHLLVPLNEAWGKPMDMTEKEWRIIGRVMEKVKKY